MTGPPVSYVPPHPRALTTAEVDALADAAVAAGGEPHTPLFFIVEPGPTPADRALARVMDVASHVNAERSTPWPQSGPTQALYRLYCRGLGVDWHRDDHPLVACVQLSDPDTYSGGDLQLTVDETADPVPMPRDRGAVLVLSGQHLHRVTPVVGGERRSLIVLVGEPASG